MNGSIEEQGETLVDIDMIMSVTGHKKDKGLDNVPNIISMLLEEAS